MYLSTVRALRRRTSSQGCLNVYLICSATAHPQNPATPEEDSAYMPKSGIYAARLERPYTLHVLAGSQTPETPDLVEVMEKLYCGEMVEFVRYVQHT